MKATFIHGPRDIRVADVPDSEPRPGEALVAVTAVGICGSDLHTYLLGNIGGIAAEQPLTLGHEAGGVIVALGPALPADEGHEGQTLRVGQRVAIDPATPCLHCEFCEVGQYHLCTRLKFMGLYPDPGALIERKIHPARSLIPVPNGISDISIALLEPLGVALHAIRLARIQVGEDVLVIGCGGIGLLIVRLARLAGARHIFAADRYSWRLDMAANYGADRLIDVDKTEVVAEVMRQTNKRGVDVALEAAWVKHTASQCVDAARHGGRVVIVGIPEEDEIAFRASSARRKEITVYNSRRMNHVYDATIALAAGGQVNLDPLATHRYTLDQTQQAFEDAGTYQSGLLRAVVLPNPAGG